MQVDDANEADQEEDAEHEDLVSLDFDEPLSWRPGKPIPVSDLYKRLDKLFKELAELDQEATEKDSLTKVAKELVAHNLLTHKDKGVKAFAACCLVDILRICAPHAPFTHTQLKVLGPTCLLQMANRTNSSCLGRLQSLRKHDSSGARRPDKHLQ